MLKSCRYFEQQAIYGMLGLYAVLPCAHGRRSHHVACYSLLLSLTELLTVGSLASPSLAFAARTSTLAFWSHLTLMENLQKEDGSTGLTDRMQYLGQHSPASSPPTAAEQAMPVAHVTASLAHHFDGGSHGTIAERGRSHERPIHGRHCSLTPIPKKPPPGGWLSDETARSGKRETASPRASRDGQGAKSPRRAPQHVSSPSNRDAPGIEPAYKLQAQTYQQYLRHRGTTVDCATLETDIPDEGAATAADNSARASGPGCAVVLRHLTTVAEKELLLRGYEYMRWNDGILSAAQRQERDLVLQWQQQQRPRHSDKGEQAHSGTVRAQAAGGMMASAAYQQTNLQRSKLVAATQSEPRNPVVTSEPTKSGVRTWKPIVWPEASRSSQTSARHAAVATATQKRSVQAPMTCTPTQATHGRSCRVQGARGRGDVVGRRPGDGRVVQNHVSHRTERKAPMTLAGTLSGMGKTALGLLRQLGDMPPSMPSMSSGRALRAFQGRGVGSAVATAPPFTFGGSPSSQTFANAPTTRREPTNGQQRSEASGGARATSWVAGSQFVKVPRVLANPSVRHVCNAPLDIYKMTSQQVCGWKQGRGATVADQPCTTTLGYVPVLVCTICRAPVYAKADWVAMLPCGHCFHEICAELWFQTARTGRLFEPPREACPCPQFSCKGGFWCCPAGVQLAPPGKT